LRRRERVLKRVARVRLARRGETPASSPVRPVESMLTDARDRGGRRAFASGERGRRGLEGIPPGHRGSVREGREAPRRYAAPSPRTPGARRCVRVRGGVVSEKPLQRPADWIDRTSSSGMMIMPLCVGARASLHTETSQEPETEHVLQDRVRQVRQAHLGWLRHAHRAGAPRRAQRGPLRLPARFVVFLHRELTREGARLSRAPPPPIWTHETRFFASRRLTDERVPSQSARRCTSRTEHPGASTRGAEDVARVKPAPKTRHRAAGGTADDSDANRPSHPRTPTPAVQVALLVPFRTEATFFRLCVICASALVLHRTHPRTLAASRAILSLSAAASSSARDIGSRRCRRDASHGAAAVCRVTTSSLIIL